MKNLFLLASCSLILFSYQNCEVPQEQIVDEIVKENSPSFYLKSKPVSMTFYESGERLNINLLNKDDIVQFLQEIQYYEVVRPEGLVCTLQYLFPWITITLENGKEISFHKNLNICQSRYFLNADDISALEDLELELKALINNENF